MIKVNLLLAKKKKKEKPIPAFLISTIFITLATVVILAYLVFFFSRRVSDREATVKKNEAKIAELKQRLKDVEDYEKLNENFQKQKDIIETLSKNKSLPVKTLDETSSLLPVGVWLTSMEIKGDNINVGCTAFTNTDVVNYVDNLKSSKFFTDIYLQESIQVQAAGISLYNFRLTYKVKR